jgi:hypothetical protein
VKARSSRITTNPMTRPTATPYVTESTLSVSVTAGFTRALATVAVAATPNAHTHQP